MVRIRSIEAKKWRAYNLCRIALKHWEKIDKSEKWTIECPLKSESQLKRIIDKIVCLVARQTCESQQR
jgi:hypothetical protein